MCNNIQIIFAEIFYIVLYNKHTFMSRDVGGTCKIAYKHIFLFQNKNVMQYTDFINTTTILHENIIREQKKTLLA